MHLAKTVTRRWLRRLGSTSLCLILPVMVQAQVVWDNGGGDNRWGTANNWNPNAVPTSTSNVQFNATAGAAATVNDIQLRGNWAANSLTFNNVDDNFGLVNGSGSRTLTLTSGNITRTAGSSNTQDLSFTTLALGANSTMNIAGSGSLTINSAIVNSGGTRSLTKTGAGELVLSGTNTFSGGTTLSAGTLTLGNDNALGTGTFSIGGGTVAATGGSRSIANTVSVTGNFAVGGTQNLTLSGSMNLNGAARTVTVNNTALTTFSGALTSTGSTGLTKAGAGTLIVSGGNTAYASDTVINAGVLRLTGYDALGTGTTNTLTINNGAELDANWGDGTNFQGNIVINDGIIRHTDNNGNKAGFQNNSPTSSSLIINGNAQLIDQDGGGTGGFLTLDGIVKLNTGANLTINAVNATDEVRFGGGQNITMSAGTTLTTAGAGLVSFGSASARTIIAEGTSAQQTTLVLGAASNTANAGSNFQINGSGSGGLRVEGTKAKVDSLMTDARIAATTGSGGTLNLAYTSGGNRTLGTAANLATPSSLVLGLESSGGTFTLGTAGGATGDLNNWAGLTVGANTTALFADNFVFNTTADLTLLGGTLSLNGTTQTFNTLTVSSNSIIDFGGGDAVLNLSNLIIGSGITLTVQNWTNAADFFYTQNWSGAVFDTSGASPMNQVVFASFTGANTKWQSIDDQVTPVPEPSTYGAILLLSASSAIWWRHRHRIKRLAA